MNHIKTGDSIPEFSSQSIKAMGPVAQGIAKILLDAKQIRIVEEKEVR